VTFVWASGGDKSTPASKAEKDSPSSSVGAVEAPEELGGEQQQDGGSVQRGGDGAGQKGRDSAGGEAGSGGGAGKQAKAALTEEEKEARMQVASCLNPKPETRNLKP